MRRRRGRRRRRTRPTPPRPTPSRTSDEPTPTSATAPPERRTRTARRRGLRDQGQRRLELLPRARQPFYDRTVAEIWFATPRPPRPPASNCRPSQRDDEQRTSHERSPRHHPGARSSPRRATRSSSRASTRSRCTRAPASRRSTTPSRRSGASRCVKVNTLNRKGKISPRPRQQPHRLASPTPSGPSSPWQRATRSRCSRTEDRHGHSHSQAHQPRSPLPDDRRTSPRSPRRRPRRRCSRRSRKTGGRNVYGRKTVPPPRRRPQAASTASSTSSASRTA